MKRILVPTDFSKNASNAIQYAYNLAKENDAKISLLNIYTFAVYDPNMPPGILADTIKIDADNSNEGLDFQIAELEKINPDIKNYLEDKIVLQGAAADEIYRTAEEKNYDLIVMGTKGASGIEEVFIGSNAYDVIAKSKVPVLVVPDKALYRGIKNILYCVDLNSTEAPAINDLKNLVDLNKADLTLLHLSGTLNDNITLEEHTHYSEIKEKLEGISYKFELAKSDNIAESIEEYSHKLSADVIVISRREKGFFENLFHKSISKKLACHTDIPLLALQK